MPRDPNEQGCEDCRAEDDTERGLRYLATGRQSREPASDGFEITFEEGKIGARLISLLQHSGAPVRHMLY